MEREYFTELYEGVIIYVYFRTIKGEVTDFVVKLLAHCEDKWHEILRYDSGHDCPHKDIKYRWQSNKKSLVRLSG